MGFWMDLIRDILREPWIPRDPKTRAREAAPAPRRAAVPEAKPFCDPRSVRACVSVCVPRGECSCHCNAVRDALMEEIARRRVGVVVGGAKFGCRGNCRNGPFLGFPQRDFFYCKVNPRDIPGIVNETLINGRILFPLVSVNPERSYRPDIIYERDSGMLVGIDEHVCMVDVARCFADMEGASAAKSPAVAAVMVRIQEKVRRISGGIGTGADLEALRAILEELRLEVKADPTELGSGLLSAVSHFQDEFRQHVEQGGCPLGVCSKLTEDQVPAATAAAQAEMAKKAKPEVPKAEKKGPAPAEESRPVEAPGGKREEAPAAAPAPEPSVSAAELATPSAAPVHGGPVAERVEPAVPVAAERPAEAEVPAVVPVTAAVEEHGAGFAKMPETVPETADTVSAAADLAHRECVLSEEMPEASAQAEAMGIETPPSCQGPPVEEAAAISEALRGEVEKQPRAPKKEKKKSGKKKKDASSKGKSSKKKK